PRAKARMRGEPGADGRAADPDDAESPRRDVDRLGRLADGLGPSGEDLTVCDRHRILKMRASRLHDATLADSQAPQRGFEPSQLGNQRSRELERHEANGGRRHVVRGLTEVHVIVRMDGRVAPAAATESLVGEIGDDLVDVHMDRRARAGVEAVEDGDVGNAAGGVAIGGGLDGPRRSTRQDAERGVGARGRLLDEGVRADERRMRRAAGELEGLARPLREAPVERARGNGLRAEAVTLSAHRRPWTLRREVFGVADLEAMPVGSPGDQARALAVSAEVPRLETLAVIRP